MYNPECPGCRQARSDIAYADKACAAREAVTVEQQQTMDSMNLQVRDFREVLEWVQGNHIGPGHGTTCSVCVAVGKILDAHPVTSEKPVDATTKCPYCGSHKLRAVKPNLDPKAGEIFAPTGVATCGGCFAAVDVTKKRVEEPRYCVKCGRRLEAADAAHVYTCEGKGNAANPAPFIG